MYIPTNVNLISLAVTFLECIIENKISKIEFLTVEDVHAHTCIQSATFRVCFFEQRKSTTTAAGIEESRLTNVKSEPRIFN